MEHFQLEENHAENILESSDVAVDVESGLAIAVIKPDAFINKDQILKRLEDSGLYIVKTVTKRLPDNFVIGTMYKDLPKGIEEETLKHFNIGSSEIILLRGGSDIVEQLVKITGDKTRPNECSDESIRYIFGEHFGRNAGEDKTYFRNAIHRGKDAEEKKADLDKFEHLL
jgi:nucleoside diphosphate kinase